MTCLKVGTRLRCRSIHLLPILLLAALPREAGACSQCVFAFTEQFLPPTLPWSIIGFVAYPLVGFAIRPPTDTPVGAFFTNFQILLWSAAGLLSSIFFGPIPFLILLAISVRGIMLSWKNGATRSVRIVAAVVLIPLVLTGIKFTYDWARRDKADFVMRWSGTGPARIVVARMVEQKDLAGLRRIVAGPDGFEAAQTAMHLAKIGDPAIDAPIMIDALRSFEGKEFEEFNVSTFNGALEALLGGTPPDGKKKAADWEEFLRSRP